MFGSPAQTWNPADYAANAAFVPALGEPLLPLNNSRGSIVADPKCSAASRALREILPAHGRSSINVSDQ